MPARRVDAEGCGVVGRRGVPSACGRRRPSRANVAAVLAAGSEKAAAHRLGLSHSTVKHHLANARSKVGVATTAHLVWILAPRLPEPTPGDETDSSSTSVTGSVERH